MSAERRLKKTHATSTMALYQMGQEIQHRLQEVQEAIDAQIAEWVPVYGLDPDALHHVEVRPDGEAYLVEIPKPAETGEIPAEEDAVL